MTTGQLVGLTGLALSGAHAAYSDLRYRRLSNPFCLAVAGFGLAQFLLLGAPAAAASAALHGFLAFVGGAVLFTLGGFGGGDAKYYAAVACWFTLGQAMVLLLAVSLCGIVLALGFLAARRFAGDRWKEYGADHAMLPFGVAIAAGALCAKSGLAS